MRSRQASKDRGGDRSACVVIPWGGSHPDWLAEQLSAVARAAEAANARGIEAEIVVSCNSPGSADAAQPIATEHADGTATYIVDSSSVRGPAHARNVGAASRTAPIILFCDADDVVSTDWLWLMATALDTSDLVAGEFDTSINRFGRDPAPNAPVRPMTIYSHLGYGPMANLGVTREIFEKVGGVSEDLMVAEDIDFCWRAQYCGARFSVVPKAYVARRWRESLLGHFRQAVDWGVGDVELLRRHEKHGARRSEVAPLAKHMLAIATRLLMGIFTGRQRWPGIHQAGKLTGRMIGSITARKWSL